MFKAKEVVMNRELVFKLHPRMKNRDVVVLVKSRVITKKFSFWKMRHEIIRDFIRHELYFTDGDSWFTFPQFVPVNKGYSRKLFAEYNTYVTLQRLSDIPFEKWDSKELIKLCRRVINNN